MNSQGRDWHYLQPLLRTTVPSFLGFIHLETTRVQSVDSVKEVNIGFRCATVITGRLDNGKLTRRHSYTTSDASMVWEFVASVTRPKHSTMLICNDVGNLLRLTSFWRLVELGHFKWQTVKSGKGGSKNSGKGQSSEQYGMVVLNDPPSIIRGWLLGNSVTVVDTQNYHQTVVAETVSSAGIEWPVGANEDCDTDAWHNVCRQRCEVIETLFCKIVSEWKRLDCGPWGLTVSSCSWHLFRRRHLAKNTVLCHNDTDALAMERWGYYGGQTLCNYLGEVSDNGGKDGSRFRDKLSGKNAVDGRVWVTDVNSLYPGIMRADRFPCGSPRGSKGSGLSNLATAGERFVCIARVRVCSSERVYPCRVCKHNWQPIVTRRSSLKVAPKASELQTVYAAGEFWTVLCGEELRLGLIRGDVAEVAEGYSYPVSNYLASFVDECWQIKEDCKANGDIAGGSFWKLILNSMSGRFGMHNAGWIDCPIKPPRFLWGYWSELDNVTRERCVYRSIGGYTQRLRFEQEGSDSSPIVSACITANARERMRQFRSAVGRRDWYYQDTDSLHLSQRGFDRGHSAGIIRDSVLGYLRLENVAQHTHYYGPKSYYQDGGYVVSGRTDTAVIIGNNRFVQWEGERMGATIASRPDDSPIVSRRVKRLHGEVSTVITDDYGWVIPPCIVQDNEKG